MNAPRSISPRRVRAGWTLLEVSIVSLLVLGLVTKASFVTREALDFAGDETVSLHGEDQARRVIDQIALAVMGSDRGTLLPQIEDVHSSHIRYTFSLGLEDGEVVWSAPEEISLVENRHAVEWRENPGAAEERRVVWTNLVSPLLEGEVMNGLDDNQNGLVDEDGLSFLLDGERVVIRLSLRRQDPQGGKAVEETVESVVSCRN